MKSYLLASFVGVLIFLTGCSSLTLSPADFSWPLESVLRVNQDGKVVEKRYSFTLNAKPLFTAEKGENALFLDEELHVIKNNAGYYFITAKSFSSVYVFHETDGALSLTNKITFEQKLLNPAFNARQPYVELVNGDVNYLLDNNGIKGN